MASSDRPTPTERAPTRRARRGLTKSVPLAPLARRVQWVPQGPSGRKAPAPEPYSARFPTRTQTPVLIDTALADLQANCDAGGLSLGVSGTLIHGYSATGDFPTLTYWSRGQGGGLVSIFDPNRVTLVFTFVEPATRKSQQVNLDYRRQAASSTCLLTGQVIPGT